MNSRRDIHPHDLLSPYLDGELDRQARSAIEEHLSGCTSCRTILRDFRSMATVSGQEAPPPVPADLRARIRAGLEAREAPGLGVFGRGIRSYRLGIAAAAGLVLVIGMWALQQGSLPPAGTPAPVSMNSGRPEDWRRDDTRTGAKPRPTEPPETAEMTDQLRALGYIGPQPEKKSEATPPPPDAQRRMPGGSLLRQKVQAPPVPPPAAVGSRPAPPDEEAGDIAPSTRERALAVPGAGTPGAGELRENALNGEHGFARAQPAGTDAVAPAERFEARPGRILLVASAAYTVRVSEDGTISLSAGEYSCSARLDGPAVDPDITALFTLAAVPEKEAPRARESAPAGASTARLVEPPPAAGKTAGAGGGVDLPAGQAHEIETRLKTLLRDRYLALMEGRCGPAPRVVRAP